jgi:hypothetical protein
MLGLCRELYRGFTVKHFHEQSARRHNDTLAPGLTRGCICIERVW